MVQRFTSALAGGRPQSVLPLLARPRRFVTCCLIRPPAGRILGAPSSLECPTPHMHQNGLASVDPERIRILRNGLRLMALRALGDDDAADDVVQETLLRALRAVSPEVAADPERLGAFVGGIARHVIADVFRAGTRRSQSEQPADPAAGDDALSRLVRRERQAQVQAAIARLASGDQQVVRASFFEGLTPAEIAGRLNEPVERVRKRKSRALARLRAVLEPLLRHDHAPDPSKNGETRQPIAAEGG